MISAHEAEQIRDRAIRSLDSKISMGEATSADMGALAKLLDQNAEALAAVPKPKPAASEFPSEFRPPRIITRIGNDGTRKEAI